MRLRSWCRSVLVVAAFAGIGAHVASSDEASLRGPDGKAVGLKAPAGGALAVVYCSAECPISNAYSPTLNALAKAFPDGRFRLLGVYVDPDLTDAALGEQAREYRLAFPVAADRRGATARKFGVTVTPEAVVLDDRGRVHYLGRIDDQFAARGKRNAAPKTAELRDAIEAVLAGREVARPRVEAVGCPLPEPPASD